MTADLDADEEWGLFDRPDPVPATRVHRDPGEVAHSRPVVTLQPVGGVL